VCLLSDLSFAIMITLHVSFNVNAEFTPEPLRTGKCVYSSWIKRNRVLVPNRLQMSKFYKVSSGLAVSCSNSFLMTGLSGTLNKVFKQSLNFSKLLLSTSTLKTILVSSSKMARMKITYKHSTYSYSLQLESTQLKAANLSQKANYCPDNRIHFYLNP